MGILFQRQLKKRRGLSICFLRIKGVNKDLEMRTKIRYNAGQFLQLLSVHVVPHRRTFTVRPGKP